MQKPTTYPLLSRILHWLMLPLLVGQIALGLWSADLALGFQRFVWISRHKSLGMLLLLLVIIRLLWRLIQPGPTTAPTLSVRQQRAAWLLQWSLYALMLLLPVSGWLMASAGKLPPSFFGWFSFPALLAPDKGLAQNFNLIHELLGWLFIGLIALHSTAAIFHLYSKDGVFARMSLAKTRPADTQASFDE